MTKQERIDAIRRFQEQEIDVLIRAAERERQSSSSKPVRAIRQGNFVIPLVS